MMAIENQQMTLWGDEHDGGDPRNWIICHLGNPRDGLRAIYLAAPIESDGERVTGWRIAIPIWNAEDPQAEFPTAPPLGLPKPAPLPELDVALINEVADADAAR